MTILKNLIQELDYELLQGNLDVEISDICYHSNKVTKNNLFVCISGSKVDGHTFIEEAYTLGARAFVVSKPIKELGTKVGELLERDESLTLILVRDCEKALALISAAFFGHPEKDLTMIGITGTKGKTTTTYMILEILKKAHRKVGLIGSIGIYMGEEIIPSRNTTPESYILFKYLRQMVNRNIKIVVMEVSSQALKRHRTFGILFDIGVFTNLEEDHIGPGEHEDFKEYLEAKSLLFRQCKLGIVNGDDPYTMDILKGSTCKTISYGLDKKNHRYARDLKLLRENNNLGICFRLDGLEKGTIRLSIPGKFNVYNALVAISVCRELGIEQDVFEKVLWGFGVKGRMEGISLSSGAVLIIDYAHNGMALRNVLATLREYQPSRLICIFGCGGNRSKARRFEMGRVSGEGADLTIITSDNPRFEKKEDIIEDILVGMRPTKGEYRITPDRREAIMEAIKESRDGEIILLAGKGHEEYQEIEGFFYPMKERALVKECEEILRR